jgi:tRNA 2-thiouridine synthesizing protein A
LLDLSGLRCPVPIVRLNAAFKDLPAGACIEVLASDPAFELDVQAWCRRTGHALLGLDKSPQGLRVRIRRSG